MKRYVSVLICVLFVMLASALRHVILPQAKCAALRHGNAARIAAPVYEESEPPMELDV